MTTKASRPGAHLPGEQRALGEEEGEAGEDREVEELWHLVERCLVDQVLVAVVEAERLGDDDQDDGAEQRQERRGVALDDDYTEAESEREGERISERE